MITEAQKQKILAAIAANRANYPSDAKHAASLAISTSVYSAIKNGQTPSHTLAAMGRDPLAIDTAIRVSFCADNTPEDVDAFLNRFEDGMKHLQKIRK